MILLLGGTGYIGQAFIKKFMEEDIEYHAITREDLDYTNFHRIFYYLRANAKTFDVLINCAGYVGKPNVDACEDNKGECIKGNVLFPEMIAGICSELMIKYVHISSGCIYTGYDKEYTEEDPPNFCFNSEVEGSFYSGTKALGEEVLKDKAAYICRLRIPFDNVDHPRNYLSKLQNYDKLLNMKNSISHKEDFVDACMHLITETCNFGTYNITNTGSVDTEQVCSLISRHLNLNNNFDFFDSEEEFYKLGAKAPRSNCLLDNSKLFSTGFKMRDTVEALEDSLKKWESE